MALQYKEMRDIMLSTIHNDVFLLLEEIMIEIKGHYRNWFDDFEMAEYVFEKLLFEIDLNEVGSLRDVRIIIRYYEGVKPRSVVFSCRRILAQYEYGLYDRVVTMRTIVDKIVPEIALTINEKILSVQVPRWKMLKRNNVYW